MANTSSSSFRKISKKGDTCGMAVIIGKNFDSQTLPDGSAQVVEVTKFKRLSDGHIYTESKIRNILDDERSERSCVRRSLSGNSQSRHDAPSKTSNDDDFICSTFSLSKSESDDPEVQSVGPISVMTEDFGELPPRHGEVDEYLYANDPSGRRENEGRQRAAALSPSMRDVPLSPPSPYTSARAWGKGQGGWSPSWHEDDNSVQVVKTHVKSFWRTPHKLPSTRNFFRSPEKNSDCITIPNTDSNDFLCGVECDSSPPRLDGHIDDDRKRNVVEEKHSWMKKRRCKILVVSIILVVIGTIFAAVMLVSGTGMHREENTSATIPDVEMSDETEQPAVEDSTSHNVSTIPSSSDNNDEHNAVATPCIHLKIHMKSTDENGVNNWSLARKGNNGHVVPIQFQEESTISLGVELSPTDQESYAGEDLSEGLPDGRTHVFKHCVQPGLYTFTINSLNGNGLGENGEGGYYITAEDVTLGVSSFFFHEEKMTFSLPLDKIDEDGDVTCTDDFFLAVKTDGKPEETKWNVVSKDRNEIVLAGGSYTEPWSVYTRRACLSDGEYAFTMIDTGGDGMWKAGGDNGKGFFVLSTDGNTILDSNGDFGKSKSVDFAIGGKK